MQVSVVKNKIKKIKITNLRYIYSYIIIITCYFPWTDRYIVLPVLLVIHICIRMYVQYVCTYVCMYIRTVLTIALEFFSLVRAQPPFPFFFFLTFLKSLSWADGLGALWRNFTIYLYWIVLPIAHGSTENEKKQRKEKKKTNEWQDSDERACIWRSKNAPPNRLSNTPSSYVLK